MPLPRSSKQPKTTRKEVPVIIRAEMYGMGLAGASVSTIHEKFPQWGRSKAREDCHLIRAAIKSGSKGRRQPLGELQANIMPDVSRTTVKRRLRDQNVRKWRAANRTMLTEAHIGDRLGWARQYEDVSEDEWA